MTDQASLVAELEATARDVPGVRQLYLAGSKFRALLKEGAKALGVGPGAEHVRVSVTEETCVVEVACAVAAGHRAGDVARRLSAALSDACRDRGLPEAKVVVTISHVST